MSKPQHPSTRELLRDTQGQLYSKEARESDASTAVLSAEHSEISRLFFKGKTQKRTVSSKNKSGHLTEHIAALEDQFNRSLAVEIL